MATNPTNSQLLDFSIDSYNPQGDSSRIADGYERLELPHTNLTQDNKDEGFAGSAYYNAETGKLIIAFAGTDQYIGSVSDLDDDSGFVSGANIAQFQIAAKFYQDAVNKVYSDFGTNLQPENIVTTGHSLGGGLAAMVGILKGVSARIFNAPGIGRQLENIEDFSEDDIDSGDLTNKDPESFDVENNVVGNDWVNYAGDQVGKVNEISTDGTVMGVVFYALSGAAGAALLGGPLGIGIGILGKFIASGLTDHKVGAIEEALKNQGLKEQDPDAKTTGEKFMDSVESIENYIDEGIKNSVVSVVNAAADWIFGGEVKDLPSDAKNSAFSLAEMFSGLFSGGNSGDVPTNLQEIDNQNLDLKIEISDDQTVISDHSDAWQTGSAVAGDGYSADMPVEVINGDGISNTSPSQIVTDDQRPGAATLVDNGVNNILDGQSEVLQNANVQDQGGGFFSGIWNSVTNGISRLTGAFLDAPRVENVDPVVLDLDGLERQSLSPSKAWAKWLQKQPKWLFLVNSGHERMRIPGII